MTRGVAREWERNSHKVDKKEAGTGGRSTGSWIGVKNFRDGEDAFGGRLKEDKIYGYLLHVPQALLYFSCANTNSTPK